MTVKDKVKQILKTTPKTRSNDLLLIATYYIKEYGTADLTRLIDREIIAMETIRRTRQQIQANGEYLANENVRENRKKLEQDYKAAKGVPDFVDLLVSVTKQYKCNRCGTTFRMGSSADEILTGMHCGSCGGEMVVDE